jgi:hypothetical protein
MYDYTCKLIDPGGKPFDLYLEDVYLESTPRQRPSFRSFPQSAEKSSEFVRH